MRRLTFVFFMGIVLSAAVSASDQNQSRFIAIQSAVMRAQASEVAEHIASQIDIVKNSVTVTEPRPTHRKAIGEVVGKFTALPQFRNRIVTLVTYRNKPGSEFQAQLCVLGHTVLISEVFLEQSLSSPNGMQVLVGSLAHELSHGRRDVLVKRAIATDTVLTSTQKEHWLLQVEIEADRTAMDLLYRAGYDPQGIIVMLRGFNEAQRLQSAEDTFRAAFAAPSRQQQ